MTITLAGLTSIGGPAENLGTAVGDVAHARILGRGLVGGESGADDTGFFLSIDIHNQFGDKDRPAFQVNRGGGARVWDYFMVAPYGSPTGSWQFGGIFPTGTGGPTYASGAMLSVGSDLGAAGVTAQLYNTNGHDLLHAYDTTAATSTGGITAGTRRLRLDAAGMLVVGDADNPYMTRGLTIDQENASDHVLTFKSSVVATGLSTSTNAQRVQSNDFAVFAKHFATGGGLVIQSMLQDGVVGSSLAFEAYGGDADTTNTTASSGMVNFTVAEHNGLDALRDIAVGGNALAVRVYTGDVFATRLLLKGDSGQLYLGNTTLVTLAEDYDDRALVQVLRSEHPGAGIIEGWPFPVPVYDRAVLEDLGVLGPTDAHGESLFAVQPRFLLNEGAILQNYMQLCALGEAQGATWERLDFLEGENAQLRERVAHLEAA